MTRDEVIAMARKAGFGRNAFSQACVRHSSGAWVDVAEELERFAALVEAAEREACAQVCDDYAYKVNSRWIPRDCAAAIRSRSTT